MGFSCGIYRVKKYKDLTLSQIGAIQDKFDYDESEWSQNNYSSWEECSKSQYCTHDTTGLTEDAFEFYAPLNIQRDFSKSITEDIDSWCSIGASFHEWFMQNGKPCVKPDGEIIDGRVMLDQSTVIGALKYCADTLDGMKFKRVIVKRAFIEDYDTEVITSVVCSGIEVEDEDGKFSREYTDDWECSSIYIPEIGYFDEDKYYAFVRLQDALIKTLTTTDFDNEYVYYDGGY